MHGTVQELVESGDITPKQRTSIDALELAATWLEAYEGDPEDDLQGLTEIATVAASLRREAAKREAAKRRGAR